MAPSKLRCYWFIKVKATRQSDITECNFWLKMGKILNFFEASIRDIYSKGEQLALSPLEHM